MAYLGKIAEKRKSFKQQDTYLLNKTYWEIMPMLKKIKKKK